MTYTDLMKADPTVGNMNGWQQRHNAAVLTPRSGFESALITMLSGWLEYANTNQLKYDSLIGHDSVLGDEWGAIGKGIDGLLNGDTGSRLDCGTLSTLIQNTLADNGVEVDW